MSLLEEPLADALEAINQVRSVVVVVMGWVVRSTYDIMCMYICAG